MSVMKKLVSIVCIVAFCTVLSGCWNYQGLNKISIVSGVAIDRKEEENKYHLTIEVFDLSGGGKESSIKSQIVETEGETIYEAVRNAKKRLAKNLYFGDIQLVVVNEKIAREEGIQFILDWFIRNEKPRETFITAVSQEKTAKDIITASGVDHKIVSEEVERILDEDNKITASSINIDTYKALNIIQGEKETALVLPAVHCVDNQDKKVVEVNGVAIFKGDRLQGYLSPEETQYYLFAIDEVKGGIFTFPFTEQNPIEQDNFSFEVSSNKTKASYSYDGDRLKVLLHTKTTVALSEAAGDLDLANKNTLEKVKETATAVFGQRLQTVIKKIQTEFGSDVFRFNRMIYKKDPALWLKLKDNWDDSIRTMEIEVNPEFTISNTGLIK
ncbi:Ger(x)C family spore germination protein [Anaerosinus massiliensis]|uniref:Ger(x)C family spore germination protein n=1 Tax=Massilibacillus massiliensis TaxID=1806837 RepID=UPI000DA64000|nr:Ger(x)C family spore germination protein [Massilibacillus massiliensis]